MCVCMCVCVCVSVCADKHKCLEGSRPLAVWRATPQPLRPPPPASPCAAPAAVAGGAGSGAAANRLGSSLAMAAVMVRAVSPRNMPLSSFSNRYLPGLGLEASTCRGARSGQLIRLLAVLPGSWRM